MSKKSRRKASCIFERSTGISFKCKRGCEAAEKERTVLENYGIITSCKCPLYGAVLPDCGINSGELSDELVSGWLVKIAKPSAEQRSDWLRITTHYGYKGYVRAACVRLLAKSSRGELMWEERKRLCRINSDFADILCCPDIRASAAATLYRDSFVERLEETKKERADGWSKVRCADGTEGYIHSVYLSPRKDDDEYFLRGNLLWQKSLKNITDRDRFRRRLVECANSYMGTQYRWGGKSPKGLDCSGFVFLCYMENGVLIYRDAEMRQGYPVHEISREAAEPGDLIYWKGHVAMYLGNSRYIHATGNSLSACVTVNSFDPEEDDYRADLAESVTAFGSIF